MKKSRQNASDRHAQLIGLLKKRGYCSVVEMSQLLNVSPMTIRRDLHMLHEKQIVEITHGGASFIASKRIEPDFDIRTHEHLPEKQAIGKLAAELFIKAGDVIGISSVVLPLSIPMTSPALIKISAASFPIACFSGRCSWVRMSKSASIRFDVMKVAPPCVISTICFSCSICKSRRMVIGDTLSN